MAKPDPTDSPLDTAASMTSARATEAFSLLGNETRLAILLALWEAADPFAEGTWDPTEGNAVSFTDLRDRVGLRQGSEFTYHLDKLEGDFVEHTADGYQLLPAGDKIVRAVIATAGFTEAEFKPTEIDLDCRRCGAPTAITYQHQRLYHVCTACEGHFAMGDKHPSGVLGAWIGLNPVSLSQRTPQEIYTTTRKKVYHLFAMRGAGICPWCSGQVDTTLHVCDTHNPGADEPCPACGRQNKWAARFVCTVCKHTSQGSVTALSLRHPAVVSFYWRHGIELEYNDLESAKLLTAIKKDADEELVSTDPPRVSVTLRHDGDEVQLTYDEAMNVVAVREDG